MAALDENDFVRLILQTDEDICGVIGRGTAFPYELPEW